MRACVFKMRALWKSARFIIHLADVVRVFSTIIYKDLYILMPPASAFFFFLLFQYISFGFYESPARLCFLIAIRSR